MLRKPLRRDMAVERDASVSGSRYVAYSEKSGHEPDTAFEEITDDVLDADF